MTTFFCTSRFQSIDEKKTWSMISRASVLPPPSLREGSLTNKPPRRSRASWDIRLGNRTSSDKMLPNITSWFCKSKVKKIYECLAKSLVGQSLKVILLSKIIVDVYYYKVRI